jgi:hypothetical protein
MAMAADWVQTQIHMAVRVERDIFQVEPATSIIITICCRRVDRQFHHPVPGDQHNNMAVMVAGVVAVRVDRLPQVSFLETIMAAAVVVVAGAVAAVPSTRGMVAVAAVLLSPQMFLPPIVLLQTESIPGTGW